MSIVLRILALLTVAFVAGCGTPTSPTIPNNRPPLALRPVQNPIPPTPAGVYDISKVDVIPVTTHRVNAPYPFELRRAGVSGQATILFIVDTQGRVLGPTIVKATDIQFGEAARQAVAQWRFKPALVAGEPVFCRLMVPVAFTLEEK
jgi:TonB family protein